MLLLLRQLQNNYTNLNRNPNSLLSWDFFMYQVIIHTPLGNALLTSSKKGLQSIKFVEEQLDENQCIPLEMREVIEQINAYFEGNLKAFRIKFDFQGTDFQKKVWNELVEIPYGKTLSYLELSNKLGNPLAIRAVANANAKNKLMIFVPCHRIIGSDGSLTGYAGGLWRKKWLLEHENVIGKQQLLF